MNPVHLLQAVVLYSCAVCSAQPIQPSNWYIRPSPTSYPLNGICCGSNLFLSCGSQGAILESTNGSDWLQTPIALATNTFFSTAYLDGFLLGDSGTNLLLFSRDGANWSDTISAPASQQMTAIAVGPPSKGLCWDASANRSFTLDFYGAGIFSSTNTVPTTNTLFAMASTVSLVGNLLTGLQFVAVGDLGTIVSSSNGINWTQQYSGTTKPLHAVVYHQGRMFVGGDSGVVLFSTDGISWSTAAPTSFDIHGFASSGNALVAVGNYQGSGRLQVSADGLTWPGNALQINQPLNAVTYGRSSFVAVGDGGLIVQSSYAPDARANVWTNPVSGYWEEPFWSSGRLPDLDQSLIAFTNSGWKALAIGLNTTANFSNSLSINALVVDAPPDSYNQLLLNYAGTNAPLSATSVTLGTNASLVSHHSALSTPNLYLHSPALFAEGSYLNVFHIDMDGSLTISNSVASLGLISLYGNGAVTQSGGGIVIGVSVLETNSSFTLDDGTLTVHELCVQAIPDFPVTFNFGPGLATFLQAGGELSADFIALGDKAAQVNGQFILENGTLNCPQFRFLNGDFIQSGGTNTFGSVSLPYSVPFDLQASYSLSGGTLISSNISLGFGGGRFEPAGMGYFNQSGGIHSNLTMELEGALVEAPSSFQPHPYPMGVYSLSGGQLFSTAIDIHTGSFVQTGGSNNTQVLALELGGAYSLSEGLLVTASTTITGYQADAFRCDPTVVFTQMGGTHIVENLLELDSFAGYELQAGTLVAPNIKIDLNSEFKCDAGVLSNSGSFIIEGGFFYAGSESRDLGQLQLLAVTNWCPDTPLQFIDISAPTATVLHFQDSRQMPWSAQLLQIRGWQSDRSAGISHQIFFGTNANALSPEQLSELVFANPAGWPPGQYPAMLLSTGELAPAVPPSITAARQTDRLILAWPGDYQLVTATNVLGPYLPVVGATSPFTNAFTEPQRYFRLSLP